MIKFWLAKQLVDIGIYLAIWVVLILFLVWFTYKGKKK